MSFVRFAAQSEIPPGGKKTMRLGLRHIVVFNVAGRLFAIEDACSHMKAPLSAGRLRGMEITCTRHAWTYDIETGKRLGGEPGCVRTFQVKIEGGSIFVDPTVAEPAMADEGGSLPDDVPPPV